MNLIVLLIVFLIVLFIYDLFIPRYNEEAAERIRSRNNTYIVGDFIVSIIVFLGVSFLFTMLIKNYLVAADCFDLCVVGASCGCIFKDTLFAIVALLVQILNIASFYQIFIHSYSYFASLRDKVFKYIIAALALISTIAAEIIISSTPLNNLSFASSDASLNIIIKFLIYGSVIIFPALVFFAILTNHYFTTKDSDDEYRPAKVIKKQEYLEDEIYNDYEVNYKADDYENLALEEDDGQEEILSDFYY